MREGWTYKKLIDECSVLYGYPFDSKCFSTSSEDMPLIRIRDVKEGKTSTFYNGEYPKEYIIHRGDYLVGMDGEFNISQWQSKDALLNQRVCKISSKTSLLLMRYVYRFLVKELKKIEDETPFVTVKHLSAKKISQIVIPIPPVAEQERIVEELDLLSGIIEKKKKQLKAYDQLALSIFYDMVGDPIANPKGWEVKTIGDTCRITCGQDHKAVKDENGKYPIYGTGGLMGWANQFRCPKNSVIIGRKGNINNPILVDVDFWNVDTAFGVTPNNEELTAIYFFFFCKEYDFTQHDVSVTIPSLRRTDILKIELPIPPLSLQQEFAEKVEAIERQKALVQQSIAETQTLFDYTMDKYFG